MPERLEDKIGKLKEEIGRLKKLEVRMLEHPDQQISLTDPDVRSMASSGRGTGMVGYNVQLAIDTTNHLIVEHEVTNVGHDRTQLSTMARRTKEALGSVRLEVVTDRGTSVVKRYSPARRRVSRPICPDRRPQTSGNIAKDDAYECPAGERLIWRIQTGENGQTIHKYWSSACPRCATKAQCTTGVNRRVSRWEHEAVLEALEVRLDKAPEVMRIRRQTAEHPFGTLKSWMGYSHFLTKTRKRVSTEMSLHVLAYNFKRVMNLLDTRPLIEAIQA